MHGVEQAATSQPFLKADEKIKPDLLVLQDSHCIQQNMGSAWLEWWPRMIQQHKLALNSSLSSEWVQCSGITLWLQKWEHLLDLALCYCHLHEEIYSVIYIFASTKITWKVSKCWGKICYGNIDLTWHDVNKAKCYQYNTGFSYIQKFLVVISVAQKISFGISPLMAGK